MEMPIQKTTFSARYDDRHLYFESATCSLKCNVFQVNCEITSEMGNSSNTYKSQYVETFEFRDTVPNTAVPTVKTDEHCESVNEL